MSNDLDLGRLTTAMQRSRLVLRRYREETRSMVQQYLGHHWSENSTANPVPVNLVSLYAKIVSRSLIARNPKLCLSTFDKQFKPAVLTMQDYGNRQIERMGLQETLARVVLNALFSIGIAKVAIAGPTDSSNYGWLVESGQPYVESIDLDDFVFDTHARKFSEVTYIGHRYRVLTDVVKKSPQFSKARKDLVGEYDELYNAEGDERISVLGRTAYSGYDEEFEDHTTLWEIYLPQRRRVITIGDNQLLGASSEDASALLQKPLRDQQWIGPDEGPYHILGYEIVPGNAMYKGPIQDLVDLHDAVNNIFRKLINQAKRQKEILGVQGGATDDAARIIDASDGDVIQMNRPEAMKVASYGMPNQANFLLGNALKDLFSWVAGNLDMMGGLSPQSRTAKQDEMLAANASGQINAMAQDTISFTARIGRALCWYWWHHPSLVMHAPFPLPGGVTAMRQAGPQDRGVAWDRMDVQVDPYSFIHQTPQQRMQFLNGVMQQVMPLMPLMQQQGIMLDLSAYLSKMAKYGDSPDLSDIITFRDPPTPPAEPSGQSAPELGGTMPQETTRNYVRRSIGQDSAGGQQQELSNALMAAGGQNGAVQ